MSDLPENVTVEKDALNVGLPKWPALIVAGYKVTEEQAAEILIRTDCNLPDFSYGGNDRSFGAQLNDLFGVPNERDMGNDNFRAHWDAMEALRGRLGKLELGYLNNSWIYSAYIGGPHGWINWNGDIFTNTYNIGKWPDTDDVAKDWAAIAEAFPYLDLRCHLLNAESCEDGGRPVVEYVVSEGKVTVKPPMGMIAPPVNDVMSSAMSLFSPNRERGITVDMLRKKLEALYGEVPQYER